MSKQQEILGKIQDILGRELSVFEESAVSSYESISKLHMNNFKKLSEHGPEVCVSYLRFILARPDRNMKSFVSNVVLGQSDINTWKQAHYQES
ncbi:hypothetical protein ACG1BZ_06610 [Microbulbifer sp. CNSA002]|uniref:hypothetical protein n=1 Tax=Microbulbifer sp. CNSA002 TaxID=3373604 RepID=UPI0039B6690F